MVEDNELHTFIDKFSTRKKRYMREYVCKLFFAIVE
jgi:hypothetical protein